MRYLFGDSSPFPISYNFLETLAAATDCCVSLLEVQQRIDRREAITEEATGAAARELFDLKNLARSVEAALADHSELSQSTTSIAKQVTTLAGARFAQASDEVLAWRDGTIQEAGRGCGPEEVLGALGQFFTEHELPFTSWGLRWRCGGGESPVQAQVYAVMQRSLAATLAVAIPSRHLWAQPVRVMQLETGLIIQLMGKNWLGRDKVLEEQLDRYWITRVTKTSDNHGLTLHRKNRDKSAGLKIVLKQGDNQRITVCRVDEDDKPTTDPVTLDGADAQMMKKLWRKVEGSLGDLVAHRSQLLAASLGDTLVSKISSPATIATAIVQALSPLVQAIGSHSRTPGELQLKRDLGDGRREELFVSCEEIMSKFASLSAENQKLFSAFGLSSEPAQQEERPRRQRRKSGRRVIEAIGQPLLPPPSSAAEPARVAHQAIVPALPISMDAPQTIAPALPVAATTPESVQPPSLPSEQANSAPVGKNISGAVLHTIPPPAPPPKRRRRAMPLRSQGRGPGQLHAVPSSAAPASEQASPAAASGSKLIDGAPVSSGWQQEPMRPKAASIH